MSGIPMLSPVTLETVQRYASNAGILAVNFDLSAITSAESFIAAITAEGFASNILGATSGNVDITEGRSTWTPDHNGKRIPFKGETHLDSAAPAIKGTIVEMTPRNIKLMSGAADITGEDGTAITIQPRATFQPGDYFDNAVWFTNLGDEGIICAEIDNALCVSGLSWSAKDKGIATAAIELRAHSDSPVLDDKLPIRYHIFRKAAEGTTTEGTAI